MSRRERRVALAAEDPAAQPHVQPDRGGLVDQHNALPVGVVQDVLGIRVVRGAERVGANPAEQLKVVQQKGVVVAFADHRDVLVLAEPREIEGLVVDQEASTVDPYGTDTHALVIAVDQLAVGDQLQLEIIEVPVAGRPPVHAGHLQGAGSTGATGDLEALGVAQHGLDLGAVATLGLGDVADTAIGAVQVGGHRDVGEVGRIGGVEPDRTVQTGIVEEVVPVALPRSVEGVLHDAGRDRLEGQRVVDLDRDPGLGTRR